MPESEQRDRFHALAQWCRAIGCCWACTIGIAIATVCAEDGESYDWRALRSGECRNEAVGRGECRERARDKWATRPKQTKGT